ncbi:phospholipase D-like domain-containing protein [Rubripirellula reticaptiva]|uniref:Major cardiolipin synthase ClsA n=1 Tax=Rubripirellula reticaptiva TaxID=2528013 RepID=A0A5C6F7E7_9BACT|nr:phospholipase D-like domain-containing protein [Rubripirellula reticaptiva]TWU56367.1 Major cardiolipin synthase ClsA [Rubripirellula reticaptiva]
MNWLVSHALVVVGFALAVPAAIHMLSQRRTPQSVWAWLVLMFVLPWVGVPLYLMFGGRKMQQLMESKADLSLELEGVSQISHDRVHEVLTSLGIPPAREGNTLILHDDGKSAFTSLMELLESAQTNIWYSTFMLADDATGKAVVDLLTKKAASGVDVKLLLDGVGSLRTSTHFLKSLKNAGGEVAWFMPVLHRPFRGRTNLRNHRKQVIVDFDRVWAGDRNTTTQYMAAQNAANGWIDLSYLLKGPSCHVYRQVFESDWKFTTGTTLTHKRATEKSKPCLRVGLVTTQVVPSGPDVHDDALLNALLTAIYQAEERIWMVTPYFVPPESLTDAICLAARRKVDVRILVPARSNHILADWARGPHLRAIQRAGGKVLAHRCMVHAKTSVFDDSLALVGSANLDERSLLLNYELVLAIYSKAGIDGTSRWIADRLGECEPRSSTSGRTRHLLESLAETVSPLL